MKSWALESYVQDAWKVTPNFTVEMGVRYSFRQPWHADWNDLANFDPRFYTAANKAIVDPATGYITGGDPFNGIVLPGKEIPASAKGRAYAAFLLNVQRLFHDLPRGFANTYYNAFAPRLGLAYRLSDKTAIRMGGGIFHARQNLFGQECFNNPPNATYFSNFYGSIDNPAGATSSAGLTTPVAIQGMDLNQKYPTSLSYSASVQRELPGKIVLDAAYVGKVGTNLMRSRNVNQLPTGAITRNPSVNPNAMRPYVGLANVTLWYADGRSSYNSFQASLERRFHSGLGFGMAYTFSKCLDNLTTPYNGYQTQKARCAFDYPKSLNLNYIYELPFLKNNPSIAGKLLSGWQISSVMVVRSGTPLSVTDSTDMAGVGPGSGAQVWNVVGSPAYNGDKGIGLPWFSKAAFAMPASGTFGNAGYNILRGPGFFNLDAALFKGFKFTEKLRSEFRAEFFNLPNHPLLGDPGTNPRSGSFGIISTKSGNRNLQLALKLIF